MRQFLRQLPSARKPGRRALYALLLALAALAGNHAHLSLFFGVDLLFGSIAVLLALSWLGTGPGLFVAIVGGAYTWVLWDHPYALVIFTAEAAAIALSRQRVRRHPLARLPLATLDALYWVLIGVPLVVLFYRFALQMDWPAVWLIASKQAVNGILNAIAAGLVLLATGFFVERDRAVPLGRIIFHLLLICMLLPSMLVMVWEIRQVKANLERDLAGDVIALSTGVLAGLGVTGAGGKPVTDEQIAESLDRILKSNVQQSPGMANADARVTVLPRAGEEPAPPGEDEPGAQSRRPVPTGIQGLYIRLPRGDYPSTMAEWRAARYLVELSSLPASAGRSLVVEYDAAPLIDRLQAASRRFMFLLLILCLSGTLASYLLTIWSAAPLRGLLSLAREHAKIAQGGFTVPEIRRSHIREISELVDATVDMATALNASFMELAQKERRLSDVINSTGTGTWEWQVQTGKTRFNDRWAEIVGYSLQELEPTSIETWSSLAHPDDLKRSQALLERHFRGETDYYECEARMRHKDGHWVWVRNIGKVIHSSADGRPLTMTGVHQDITDRYRDQEKISRSESRLSAMFDNAPIGIVLVGSDRRSVLANRALLAFLGRSASELAELRFEDFTHPEDREKDVNLFGELTRGERTSYRLSKRYLRPDGSVIHGDLRMSLLPSVGEEPALHLAMVEDITELQQAIDGQRAAKKGLASYATQLEALVNLVNQRLPTQAQYEALLHLGCANLHLPAATLGVVSEGASYESLARVGDGTEDIPKPSVSELKGVLTHRDTPFMTGPGPDMAAQFSGHEHDCLFVCREAPGCRHQEVGTRCNGEACAYLSLDTSRPDNGKETLLIRLYGSSTAVDIDRPQRQVLHLISQRIAAVRLQQHLQQELIRARERQTIGHLANGVAHDFNNLLGVIDANLYYLGMRYGDVAGLDGDLQQVVEETRSAIGQAKVITTGMLALSRAGGVPLAQVDIPEVVAELQPILVKMLPLSLDLSLEIEPGLKAWSNGAFLLSALLNVVLNARDAMPDGGTICITGRQIRLDPAEPLRIGGPLAADCAELAVTDSGRGIPPELHASIFEPLFSTKTEQRGHGLGLFMVREFIARSRAGLALHSEPGGLTCFRILLPIEHPDEGVSPAEVDSEQAAVSKRPITADASRPRQTGSRILLVDDDYRVCEATSRLLIISGFRVEIAEHGQECLDRLASDADFQAVLSDIAMPVMDGLELHRLARERYPHLPVVLMTGQQGSEALLDGADGPAPTVLQKPVDPELLRQTLDEQIAGAVSGD